MLMPIKRIFFRTRLAFLMYGFACMMRLAVLISKDFRAHLATHDYSFIMGSPEEDTYRYFQFIRGRVQSVRGRRPSDFSLIWRDNRSGGKVMIDLAAGKRKALNRAVMHGLLTLEGEGKYISLLIETMNRLNRLFRHERKTNNRVKAG